MAAGARVGAASRRRPPTGPALVRRSFELDFAHRSRTFKRLASSRELSVDDVHQLRVATRRLRAALSVLRHGRDRGRFGRAQRELRSFGRALGACRSLDIAIRDARVYHVDTARLEKRRARAGAALRRALKPARVNALVTDLRRVEKVLDSVAFERVSAWIESLEWDVAYRLASPPRTADARHELRIELKKVRYVIESLGRRSAALPKLQDQLGREHDLIVLQSLVGRVPGAARDERRARARARALIRPALISALRNLRAIRRDLRV